MSSVSLSSLDSFVAEHSLLQHPFYLKWSRGELTLEELRVYALEYFHLAASIPSIVERILERIPASHENMRGHIEENLAEEKEHTDLWKRFARSLGISNEELMTTPPSADVQEAIASLQALAEKSFDDGIIAMYAFECELAKIAETKKEGLTKFYNLTSEDAHIYFDEHLKEEEHLKVWRQVQVDAARAVPTAGASVAAQHKVLDAVCHACNIPLHC